MISTKGKPHFWSRLLLSMIAIFALPAAQGLENSPLGTDSYPNEQRQAQQQIQHTVSLVRQVQSLHMLQSPHFCREAQILHQNEPHFCTALYNSRPPIRAGPLLT
ncbi:secA translation cis-regulator SecM [Actinobacillus succinogenes]|uniref:secA translation cis-regulator SecM n=2 Tax=Pasteurellaceae TaxID=712 RepID=UPI00359C5D97